MSPAGSVHRIRTLALFGDHSTQIALAAFSIETAHGPKDIGDGHRDGDDNDRQRDPRIDWAEDELNEQARQPPERQSRQDLDGTLPNATLVDRPARLSSVDPVHVDRTEQEPISCKQTSDADPYRGRPSDEKPARQRRRRGESIELVHVSDRRVAPRARQSHQNPRRAVCPRMSSGLQPSGTVANRHA